MNTDSASGAIRKAVSGEAAFSTSWAKPNTRPWRSDGIDRCRIVCSLGDDVAHADGAPAAATSVATPSSHACHAARSAST